MSVRISNKVSFSDSFQFLSASKDIFVKKLNKGNFKYVGQKFGNNVLDLVKIKEFYPYE